MKPAILRMFAMTSVIHLFVSPALAFSGDTLLVDVSERARYATPTTVNRADSLALVALFFASDWQQWRTRTRWLQGPIRNWYGVTVEEGRVTRLELPDNNLWLAADVNSIPPEIGDLAFLRVLNLQGNQLRGAVPPEVTRLTRLEELYLSDNFLEALPDLSPLGALRTVRVANNRLTFEDVEPNVGQGFDIDYAPQRPFSLVPLPRTASEGRSVTLRSDVGGEHNRYQWYLDGFALEGATSSQYTIPSATVANAGPYRLEVTNTQVPDLILESRPRTLEFAKRYALQWLDIGAYHHVYTATGGQPDRTIEGTGMEYPAIMRHSGHMRTKSFWVGVQNWTDPDGWHYPYYVARVGDGAGITPVSSTFSFPVQHTLIGRYEDTVVEVNGMQSFDNDAILDAIDPDLSADRMIHNIANMSMGITVDRKIYAYTNEYHDNYHLIDYTYCNTGNVDADDEIELPDQTLHDVYFFRSHSWRGAELAIPATTAGQLWGRYITYDVVGDGHEDYPVDFTAQYAWIGWTIGSYSKNYDDLGGPLLFDNHDLVAPGDTFGRLTAATMVGRSIIHADRSTTDRSYDRGQPSIMSWLNNDDRLNRDGQPHEAYYRLGIVAPRLGFEESDCIPCRRTYPHFADLNQPGGRFWEFSNESLKVTGGIDGGHAATEAYGPYEMGPGECVNVTVSEGIAGLSFDAATKIGRAFKRGGSDQDTRAIPYDANRDGTIDSTAFDYDRVFVGAESQTKNQWVMSARDSLFQTFYRARDAFEASLGMTVYPVAEPPRAPIRFTLTSRPPAAIDLAWTPAPEGPTIERWELFRTENREDNLYVNGCLEDASIRCGYELVVTLPVGTTSYTDTDVAAGMDYFYYIQAVGEPQPEAEDAIAGTPGGAPLRSSRYLTQTYTAISPDNEVVEIAEAIPRIEQTGNFPNPFSEETKIRYMTPVSAEVRLIVYDILGREVARLVDGFQDAGIHEVTFVPKDLADGVYLYILQAGNLRTEGNMLLIR